jgi:hypothetical protein
LHLTTLPNPALPETEGLELSSALVGGWSWFTIKEVKSIIPGIIEAPYRGIPVDDGQLC